MTALSYGQHTLWIADRLTPGTPLHNVPWVLPLTGPVDEDRLKAALNAVVARHAVLRTGYVPAVAEPRQQVHPAADIDLPVQRCRPDQVRDVIHAEVRRPFDLERELPIRARLVRSDSSILIVVFHHAACDELSLEIFQRELAVLYAGDRLPTLAWQYSDYATWQRERDARADLDYWARRLQGAPDRLDLRTDRPRPPVRTVEGATYDFDLPPAVAAQVRGLATAAGVSSFTILFTSFNVLLHRYTGQDDLVIGCSTVVRDRIELEELIGYFITLLPVRTRIEGERRFIDLLNLAWQGIMDDFEHRHAPLGQLAERQRPRLAFGVHTTPAAKTVRLGEASGIPQVHTTGTAKFDQLWSIFEDGLDIRGEIEYNSGLFDAATIERMAAHWLTLLAAAVEAPHTPVADLPLMTQADKSVVAVTSPVRGAPNACLHERFETTAATHPGRLATDITYAELDRRSSQLAHHLRARGIRPGDHVGLLLERTPRQVEVILAVLKAGAAYVPISPDTPPERVAFILADAGVKVVLADQAGDGVTIGLREEEHEIAACPTGRLESPGPNATAYIIYTSGSTGRPKGVPVSHANVAELFAATEERFTPGPRDVWTLFHSYAFDFSVWEIWGALLYGGRIVSVPRQVSRSPEAFADLLRRERVTVLSQTPSAFAQLTALVEESPQVLRDLRWVVLGGEALRPQQVRRWFAAGAAPNARLCNMYGITETTVHVTAFDISPETPFERSVVGRPLAHLSAEVLDPRGHPVPVGVPGELVVGGFGVAGSYLGRPGLTAQRFRPDPAVPGARRYHSGDLARWLPDGNLEYLGRIDDQVKIRGFRIEPGEIHQVLMEHPAVRAGAVVVTDGRLIAYAVLGAEATTGQIRAHLAGRLPDYMVPSAVIVVDRIPLTVNGKVDRRALPTASRAEKVYDPPQGPVEQALAASLAEVLTVERVSRQDSFMDLGGDSVRAVQVVGRLRRAGYTLPLDVLFTHPTVAEAAGQAIQAGPAAAAQPYAQLDDGDLERALAIDGLVDAYPMTAMQLAMVYHMELDPELRPYQNVNSYRVAAPLDEAALERAVREAAERHPVLRTCFDLTSFGEPMQLVRASVPLPLTTGDLTGTDQHKEITALVEREWSAPFDLGRAPLFRVNAQRLSPESFQLTIVEHHAILDGWSFTSLLAELINRHALLSRKPETPPQAPPASRFSRFVALEREAAGSAESLAFWKERLASADGAVFGELSAGPTVGRTIEREVPGELSRAMTRLAQSAGVSLKSVALTAHLVALSRASGRTDVVTGLGQHGRVEEAAGAEVLGLFLNIVPFTLRLDGGTWMELVRRVHREEVAIMPHRRVPFAIISRFMRNPELAASFTFNRFHALAGADIDDERLGSAPTMRYEPNHFALSAVFVQDPASDRALLLADHPSPRLPHGLVVAYSNAYLLAAYAMTVRPYSDYRQES
ncbi:amino acid adenylation domain-containing protein [Nonomuraea endophytica]|uniref:amino acid adenylation domain-containing protein n=1 Tax=Nonomuraea endophytica TaxID=714136 RepID=UPI0037C7A85E